MGRLADCPRTSGRVLFEYDSSWKKRLEISPFYLPTSAVGVVHFDFPQAPWVHNLPGVFWDSLPDSWGRPLLEKRMVESGDNPSLATGTLWLSHVGSRGVGALRYEPESGSCPALPAPTLNEIDEEALLFDKDEDVPSEETPHLVHGGAVLGGAQPKAGVFIDRHTEALSLSPCEGYEPWIIKLSTAPKDKIDHKHPGRVEAAFALMARAAGLVIPETKIFHVSHRGKVRGLFGVRRFDWLPDGSRLHVQTYASLVHTLPAVGASSYETLARHTQALTGDQRQVSEIFRRCAFNVMTGNRDDHLKNFSFLMEPTGHWRLAPAYDLNPAARENMPHCTAVNGSLYPSLQDVRACGRKLQVHVDSILRQVEEALAHWFDFARQCGVEEKRAKAIQQIFKAGKAGKVG